MDKVVQAMKEVLDDSNMHDTAVTTSNISMPSS